MKQRHTLQIKSKLNKIKPDIVTTVFFIITIEVSMQTQVTMRGLCDEVEVMASLQRPKKLGFVGSDGKQYVFLAKPKDDLRKDTRMMEFNGLLNRLLAKSPASRRRNLYIRTFAVIPLTEECGLVQVKYNIDTEDIYNVSILIHIER